MVVATADTAATTMTTTTITTATTTTTMMATMETTAVTTAERLVASPRARRPAVMAAIDARFAGRGAARREAGAACGRGRGGAEWAGGVGQSCRGVGGWRSRWGGQGGGRDAADGRAWARGAAARGGGPAADRAWGRGQAGGGAPRRRAGQATEVAAVQQCNEDSDEYE